MGTIIIIAVLVVLVLFAFRGSFAHFKGEGGCCGGGGSEPKQKKRKSWPVKSLLPRLSVLKACTVKTVKIP